MSKTGAQPGSDRVPVPGGVHGEVMVFQPMAIIDISHGGVQIETEFPLQEVLVRPAQGKLVLFPPFWTHVHRGVTLQSGVKYIATTWVCFA